MAVRSLSSDTCTLDQHTSHLYIRPEKQFLNGICNQNTAYVSSQVLTDIKVLQLGRWCPATISVAILAQGLATLGRDGGGLTKQAQRTHRGAV